MFSKHSPHTISYSRNWKEFFRVFVLICSLLPVSQHLKNTCLNIGQWCFKNQITRNSQQHTKSPHRHKIIHKCTKRRPELRCPNTCFHQYQYGIMEQKYAECQFRKGLIQWKWQNPIYYSAITFATGIDYPGYTEGPQPSMQQLIERKVNNICTFVVVEWVWTNHCCNHCSKWEHP